MKFTYKQERTFEERLQEGEKISKRYPNCVPVSSLLYTTEIVISFHEWSGDTLEDYLLVKTMFKYIFIARFFRPIRWLWRSLLVQMSLILIEISILFQSIWLLVSFTTLFERESNWSQNKRYFSLLTIRFRPQVLRWVHCTRFVPIRISVNQYDSYSSVTMPLWQ